MSSLLLTILVTLGGVGLYLAMPGGRRDLSRAALILLAGAAAALIGMILPLAGARGEQIWFALLAVVGLAGALRVITHRKPIYSALYFVLVVIAVAGMLILMEATFLAAALLIIYAGAILVTYVFVIMLAQQSGGPASYDQRAREPFAGVVTGFILLAALTWRLTRAGANAVAPTQAGFSESLGDVVAVGKPLLTQYIVGVELTGLLLLAAMVGAIAIARRRAAPTAEEELS